MAKTTQRVVVLREDYERKPVKGHLARASRTQPNQGLTIRDILERFTKRLPVDVKMYDPVYLDQTEHDLEKLNRMDFDDKIRFGEQLVAEKEAKAQEAWDASEALREQREREAKEAEQAKKAEPPKGSIVNP